MNEKFSYTEGKSHEYKNGWDTALRDNMVYGYPYEQFLNGRTDFCEAYALWWKLHRQEEQNRKQRRKG